MTSTNKWLLVLALFVIAVFGIAIYRQLPVGDYQHHLLWAREIGLNGYTYELPHTLFQKLVIIIRTLIPFRDFALLSPRLKAIIDARSYDIATWVLMMIALVVTSWIVFDRFKRISENDDRKNIPLLGAGLTIVVMLVGPVFLFTMPNRMYLGYITGNVYHNPTILLLRPLVLLIFSSSIKALYSKSSWKTIFFTGLLVILAAHAKPSFLITFLPSLAIFALIQIKNIKELNWRFVFFALGIPAALVLGEQFVVTYVGTSSDKIIFAPFKAILQYVPNIPTSLWFILLSILFPLSATVFYWREFSTKPAIKLAWLNFGVGLILALGFTEVINMPSLNFWWGPMVGVFILFVETIGNGAGLGMFNFTNNEKLAGKIVLSIILALHLICGVIYFLNSILYPAPII